MVESSDNPTLHKRNQAEGPPGPPEIDRRLPIPPKQAIGLVILVAFPLLALFGMLGDSDTRRWTDQNGLAVTVEYPDRLRYMQNRSMEILVRNQGTETAEGAVLELSRQYLDGFVSVAVTPQPQVVTDQVIRVELGDIPAGEARSVSVDYEGGQYGSFSGLVSVNAEDRRAELPVSTFIFP